MTDEERALFQENTMLGSRDRQFCGITLNSATAVNQRYLERMMSQLKALGYTLTEVSLGYAFLLSIPIEELRRVSRNMDLYDEAFDAFLAKLPRPLPPEEGDKLQRIVEGDIAEIKAAQFKVEPKPGEVKAELGEPGNS